MSDWHECPNLQECTEGNRFGKGCVEDNVQNAMGGKPWHECHCGVDSDGNPPNLRQADTITALRAENEKLRAALLKVTAALNEGRIVPRAGVSGMTIEAQLRNSVYTGVPAWPIEEAREMLDEINSRAALEGKP